eukprot:364556-Chlamydomonas_euryale.AAC.27
MSSVALPTYGLSAFLHSMQDIAHGRSQVFNHAASSQGVSASQDASLNPIRRQNSGGMYPKHYPADL